MHQRGHEAPDIFARRGFHCIRKLLVSPRALCLGLLRARYPIASFFSSLDVLWRYRAIFAAQPLGLFHRPIRGRLLGLHQPVRYYILSQRPPLDLGLDQHRPS